jgi:hypothetical protein
VQITINAHRMGRQPQMLLSLAQQDISTDGAVNTDRLVMRYLSSIGLLVKLEATVRALTR